MTSIALGMIVRDAEAHLARCIASALPVVDRAVIIDTGSEDNTVAVAREALGDLPTAFHQSEWVGHAHNRSELLELVKEYGPDYCLMLDADMELVQEAPVRDLVKDEYMIPIRDRGLVYPLPLLTSTKKRYFYAGVAHSYLACHDAPTDGEVLTEWALIDHGGGGHRPGKIERDAELLAAEVGKNPGDARSWFYLAQSYRDLGEVEKAIAAYKIRAGLGGWDEELYNALYQAGMLLCAHINYYDGAKLLIAAAEMKPNRAEALRALAGCSMSVADKLPQPLDEVLFVEPGAYRHHAKRPARPEVEEIFFHRYTPQKGDIVVELGAGEGTETGLLATLVGPEGTVVAVEAHPETYEKLRDACGRHKNVVLLNYAAAESTGSATISDEALPWRNRLVEDGAGLKVSTQTLDLITAPVNRIDLLKINIEGTEADVLESSPETLAKTANVVVSCHDFAGIPTKARTRAALEQAGFDVAVHDDPQIITDGHGGRCLGDYLYAARLAPVAEQPPVAPFKARRRPRTTELGLDTSDVSAVIVTRGNVDLAPVIDKLPYDDIVVWNNSVIDPTWNGGPALVAKKQGPVTILGGADYKCFGRYAAIPYTKNPVIFWVDDDVIFSEHESLLALYEPGRLVSNMDPEWAGVYQGSVALVGAGSLCDAWLPAVIWGTYFSAHPWDDDVLVEADFAFGTLAPSTIVDVGFDVREFTDDPDRLYRQPGQTERKWRMIHRCREMLAQQEAA